MLFIGDIHITGKHSDHILTLIEESILLAPAEKNIIFMGDMVYHFNYDRKALLQLFALFITLVKAGKTLYILAGNHDRIADHYVYEEARQTLFSFLEEKSIYFITTPEFHTIEGNDCLLFPFYYPNNNSFEQDHFPELYDEHHQQRTLSRKANNILHNAIQERKQKITKTEKLLLIHHRYIAGQQFPGQQAVFNFSSPALHKHILDDPAIWLISGHLHQAFCFHRYLCTGSIWHTSPLEENQQKRIFSLNTKERILHAIPISYNPYINISIDTQELLNHDTIHNHLTNIVTKSKESLSNSQWAIVYQGGNSPEFRHITLTLLSGNTSIITEDIVEKSLLQSLKTVKQKSISRTNQSLIEDLDRASLDLSQRFSDRKLLLDRFLEKKYQHEASDYKAILQELKIL